MHAQHQLQLLHLLHYRLPAFHTEQHKILATIPNQLKVNKQRRIRGQERVSGHVTTHKQRLVSITPLQRVVFATSINQRTFAI